MSHPLMIMETYVHAYPEELNFGGWGSLMSTSDELGVLLFLTNGLRHSCPPIGLGYIQQVGSCIINN